MPIYQSIKTTEEYVTITLYIVSALKYWQILVHHLAENPTPVQIVVIKYPDCLQYIDICQLGAGRVIAPGFKSIQLWVCPYVWPQNIQNELEYQTNPKVRLTINNIKLVGLVMGWLVLEYGVDIMKFKHIGSFCDNKSAV